MSNEFKAQFVNEMNRLAIVFPGVNNKERLGRYFGYIFDLDIAAFKEIINGFIDNYRQMPLPMDFDKAAKEYKKNYYFKTGKYYETKEEIQRENIPDIDCKYCLDTGFTKIINLHNKSDFRLMRCDCPTGLNNKSIMPHWASELKQLYIRELLDPNLFKPSFSDQINEKNISFKIKEKVDEWLRWIKQSEKYWIELGFTKNSNLGNKF